MNEDIYSYADLETTYDDTTGMYTETLTIYYYDCYTDTYSSKVSSTEWYNNCADTLIPSGYSYDSSKFAYTLVSSSTTYADDTAYYTTTITTSIYDCDA